MLEHSLGRDAATSGRHVGRGRHVAAGGHHSWVPALEAGHRRHVGGRPSETRRRTLAEGRTHGRVAHSGGRRNVSDSAGGATDGHRSVALTLHGAGDFRRLSAAWSAHIEVEGSGEVGTSCDVALVGVHESFGGSVSSGSFGFAQDGFEGLFDFPTTYILHDTTECGKIVFNFLLF